MIATLTDFGVTGPYTGQMHAAILQYSEQSRVVDLISDLPRFTPELSAYLIPRLADHFPVATVFVCVVDPGVGSSRLPLMVEADGKWYVGPDNGLLALVVRRASQCRIRSITWRPKVLSNSFHGRDLFAPVAAKIVDGESVQGDSLTNTQIMGCGLPDDLPKIIYIDDFGNLVTGMRAAAVDEASVIALENQRINAGFIFSECPPGEPFWHVNSMGLIEIAVNQGSARDHFDARLGDPIKITGDL
ncbi:MAG: SAM-dependent chlorinase/fluorinase [gamma proteobacterium endosymbiont of Lamellibrachia anaximandri]|nr:SAM-dependent chlorinase/fluorinase [gamma proteobacterium endosymbiont of Lamellibrachia anaximandri]MBL3616643.1 SAM-dependent chlorinase/fluorinase [gamma proteobacterium endosymbiont of Lamellibrachia anaximandri]